MKCIQDCLTDPLHQKGCASDTDDTAGVDTRGRTAGALPISQARAPHRIFVVDDDVSIRELNTVILLESGYAVNSAGDGDAAWAALNADNYDLLITDNNMPKTSGIELIRKLRAAHMDLPVIMATGMSPDHEFTRRPWLKPQATLLKPYTILEMLQTVQSVLSATACPRGQPNASSSRECQSSPEPLDLR